MLRRAAAWAGLLGVALLPLRGWAAPAPTAVQPLVQPQPQNSRPPRAMQAPAAVQAPKPAPAAAFSADPAGPRPEVFGRWQPRLQRCERNLAGTASGECDALLVDQRSAGVMRVSWPGRGGPGQASVLTFVGTLAGGSEPMACRQAICSLRKPIELTLSSVSQSLFDGRGVASGLPSAWPVNGSCRLDTRHIRCEARALSGETWTASADLN